MRMIRVHVMIDANMRSPAVSKRVHGKPFRSENPLLVS
jgi:hypothetical protein